MKIKKMVFTIFIFALGYKIISSIMCYLDTIAMINGDFPRAYKCISDIKKSQENLEHQIRHQNLRRQKYIKVEKK